MMVPMAETSTRLPIPDPVSVWRWYVAMYDEISRAPATLRRARRILEDLAKLPEQIERLTETLHETVGFLQGSVGTLSEAIGNVMNDRVEHLDRVVTDLRDTLTALIGAVPGARRALQSVARPPRDG